MLLLALLACHPKTSAPTEVCDGADYTAADGTTETCATDQVCVDGIGCAACQPVLTSPYADPAGPLVLETATSSTTGILRSRPVTISTADNVGGATLSVTGPAEVLDATGAPVSTLASLPATVYLRATGIGAATLTATFTGGTTPCADDATVALRGVVTAPLTGRPTTGAPAWESATSAMDVDPIYVALDPVRYADRVGLPYQIDVVAHKTPEQWAADPTLTDVTGAVESGTLTDGSLNVTEVWADPPLLDPTAGDDASARYDVVVDFGADGRLDPGDLIQGPGDDFGLVRIGDLAMPGTHTVDQIDIDGGLYLKERIYWPDDIAAMGPRPVVIISHGNGHLYTWYDYIGQHLASWGFVVMAHENHTEPGIEAASSTTLSNTDYFLANLDTIADGAMFGLVDPNRIGWIGHSRGGEGIVRAYDRVADGDYVPEQFTADSIRMLITIAPTVFFEVNKSNPHDRPLFLIAGTADGDVTGGVDCDQCDFYRIWEADTGPKASAYIHGADHNDFNCCGADDAMGPDLIGRDEAQVIAKGYFLAMARTYLDDDPTLQDVFRREFAGFRPDAPLDTDVVATTYRDAQPVTGSPDTPDLAVLDDFQSQPDVTLASSGGVVTSTVDGLTEDKLDDGDNTMTWMADGSDPMNGMAHAATYVDQAQGAVFSWGSAPPDTGGDTGATAADGSWEVAVMPTLTDATAYRVLSISFGQVPRSPITDQLDAPLSFGIELTDADGVTSMVDLAGRAEAPYPYQRTGSGDGAGWSAEYVTARIPLADYTVGSMIDLSRLSSVKLVFGAVHGAQLGAIGLDNVEFAR